MRRYIAPIVAVVLIGLIIWSYIHFKDYRPVSTDTRLIRPPEILLSVEEIKLAGRAKGQPMWRLEAKRLTLNQNRAVTTLEDIRDGTIYDDGKPAASVKAGRAVYDSARQRLDVSGGVRVGSKEDGTVMETSRVTYEGLTRRIICPSEVKIVRGESHGTVDRLVADLAQQTVEADNLRMRTTTKELERRQEASDDPR